MQTGDSAAILVLFSFSIIRTTKQANHVCMLSGEKRSHPFKVYNTVLPTQDIILTFNLIHSSDMCNFNNSSLFSHTKFTRMGCSLLFQFMDQCMDQTAELLFRLFMFE